MIDKDLVIVEIDEFNRSTATERYSRKNTREFHRLIIGNKEFERSSFYFRSERAVWRDTLEEDLIYEVTQLKI